MRIKGKRRKLSANEKTKILRISITVLMCLVALFTLFWYIRSLLPVKSFIVSGGTEYDEAELFAQSGIKLGDKLYSIDTDEAERVLLQRFPYLETVEVDRIFPNTVIFTVTEKVAHWYVEVSGSYYSIDRDFKVIEETASNAKLVSGGVPQIILPELRRVICGSVPEFGADESEVERTMKFLGEIQTTMFKSRLTLVDVDSRFDVNVVVDGKYFVYLGDTSNVKEKLKAVEEIIKRGDLNAYAGAEIDASIPETVSVKPIYTFE